MRAKGRTEEVFGAITIVRRKRVITPAVKLKLLVREDDKFEAPAGVCMAASCSCRSQTVKGKFQFRRSAVAITATLPHHLNLRFTALHPQVGQALLDVAFQGLVNPLYPSNPQAVHRCRALYC